MGRFLQVIFVKRFVDSFSFSTNNECRPVSLFLLVSVFFFALSTCAGSAFAGPGWVSSGGEILRDTHNPWFLKNTKTVKYCIAIDKNSISTSEAQIRYVVNDSIKQWKEEFARASIMKLSKIEMGTQSFVEVLCDGREDLRFQFGWGTISPEQMTYFSNFNFRNFAAFTVRTDYDPIQMRGRGFIYFASDKGPFRYEDPGSGHSDVVDEAWSYTGLLSGAVQHELGHVFGLTHAFDGVMAEWFVDWILNKEILQKTPGGLNTVLPLSGVVSFDTSYSACGTNLNQELRRWLELGADADCLKFSVDNSMRISLGVTSISGRPTVAVGSFDALEFHFHFDSFQTLYLPPGQKVVPDSDLMPYSLLFLKGNAMVLGDIRLNSGQTRMIQIILRLGEAEIFGVADVRGRMGLHKMGALPSDSRHRLDAVPSLLQSKSTPMVR